MEKRSEVFTGRSDGVANLGTANVFGQECTVKIIASPKLLEKFSA